MRRTIILYLLVFVSTFAGMYLASGSKIVAGISTVILEVFTLVFIHFFHRFFEETYADKLYRAWK